MWGLVSETYHICVSGTSDHTNIRCVCVCLETAKLSCLMCLERKTYHVWCVWRGKPIKFDVSGEENLSCLFVYQLFVLCLEPANITCLCVWKHKTLHVCLSGTVQPIMFMCLEPENLRISGTANLSKRHKNLGNGKEHPWDSFYWSILFSMICLGLLHK